MFKLISLKQSIKALHLFNRNSKCFSTQDFFDDIKSKTQDKGEKKQKGSFSEEAINEKDDQFKAVFYSKKQKNKKRELLKREMNTNPEFFNAFPHLKDKAIQTKDEGQEVEEDSLNINMSSKSSDYFDSLKRKYKDYDMKKDEEKILENEAGFVDAYSRREGPKKYMSREEKDSIHHQIDEKMRELENTGLSREEILLNKPIGIPLKSDKFFQYLKNNKIAREMLIKPGEAFNVDTVIEKALKQDIGPDPSLPAEENHVKYKNDLDPNYEVRMKTKLHNIAEKNKLISSDIYNYEANYLEKSKIELNFQKTRPVSFANPPLSKAQYRKKFMIRNMKKKDITWKNIPLLTKFINEIGQIMNRYQTRLPTPIQRKVAKTVKHARNLGLLPFCDYIKPQDKIPLTSVHTNFYESTVKLVDQQTGRINIMSNPLDKEKFVYSSYDVNEARENLINHKKFEQLKDSLTIDSSDLNIVPSEAQREWITAQNFLFKKDKFEGNNIIDEEISKEEEKVFLKVAGTVIDKLHINNLTENFIYEKSYDIDKINETQKYFSIVEKKENYKEEINKINDEINRILKETQLLKSSIDYQREFSRVRSGKDPEMDIDQYSSNIDIELNSPKKKVKRMRKQFLKRNVIDVESPEEPKMNKI